MSVVVNEIEQPVLNAFVLPDEQYDKLSDELSTKSEMFIRNKEGFSHRFWKEDDAIRAVNQDIDNSPTYKVVKQSQMDDMKREHIDMKDYLKKRIRDDFPDMTEEQVEQDADILNEANESIKRLIKHGIPVDVAKRVILSVLECKDDIQSPEQLSERLDTLIGASGMGHAEQSQHIVNKPTYDA